MGAVGKKGGNEIERENAHEVRHPEGMRCSCGSPFYPRNVSGAFSYTRFSNVVSSSSCRYSIDQDIDVIILITWDSDMLNHGGKLYVHRVKVSFSLR